jgi:hypothetical protein
MAWIKSPNGMWQNTDADPLSQNAWMTDQQYQASGAGANPADAYYKANPGRVSESGMTTDAGSFNLMAPQAGATLTSTLQNIVNTIPNPQNTISLLMNQGYFNQFPEYANNPQLQNELGSWVASRQGELANRHEALGIKGFSTDDLWALSVLTAPFTVGAAMGSGTGAAGAGAGAGAEGAAGSAGLGATAGGAGGLTGGGLSGGAAGGAAAGSAAGTGAAGGGALVGGTMVDGAMAGGSGFGAAGGASAGALGAGEIAGSAGGGTTAGGVGAGTTAGAGASGLSSLMSNPQVLGALGGAAISAFGGGSKPAGNVTVNEGLPDWLMPYAKPALDKYSTEVMNYQTDPYGIMPSAMQEFLKTIQGQYLDPSTNKWLPEYFKLGAERVKGALSPTFGHMQAFGQHSGYNEALSRGLGDLAVGLYGGAYEKERDRQNQMIGGAPNFLTQGSLSKFAPYGSYLSSLSGLGSKKEQPYFDDPWGRLMGGAMVGSQVGKAFYS